MSKFLTAKKAEQELQEAKEINYSLESKASEFPEETVSVGVEEILGEMTTVRQMAKMTCGRQGNQFPILSKEFFHCLGKETGFRENVIRELEEIESIDPGWMALNQGMAHVMPLFH